MIKISVKMDMKKLAKDLDTVARKQIPYATAQALTRTARGAEQEVKREMRIAFDRPTPWVVDKGTFVKPAFKSRLEAVVGIKDLGPGKRSQATYLREHIAGGGRGNKPMESAMRAAGILPPGWLAVPSKDGVKRDQYGNVSMRTIAGILGELKKGVTKRAGANSFRLFIVRPGQTRNNARHLAPGIWSVSTFGRRGGDSDSVIKPVFLFVQAATYRRVFELEKVVGRVVNRDFWIHFDREFDAAMRSAQ